MDLYTILSPWIEIESCEGFVSDGPNYTTVVGTDPPIEPSDYPACMLSALLYFR